MPKQSAKMLGAVMEETVPTGWGTMDARFYRYGSGRICGLPHLSRFGIFNRGETAALEQKLKAM